MKVNDERDFIQTRYFKELDVSQPFFDSLRADYKDFDKWFKKKSDEKTSVMFDENGFVIGFLYLKDEDEEIELTNGVLPKKNRVKIGTLKLPDGRGTSLGSRFISIALRYFASKQAEEIYVTVYEKQAPLIHSFEKYGFHTVGKNQGGELVLLRSANDDTTPYSLFPKIKFGVGTAYHLAFDPEFHSILFPEALLDNEQFKITDNAPANTVEKTYLTKMQGTHNVVPGDKLVIYRKKDSLSSSPAHFSAVASGVGTVVATAHISQFNTKEEFIAFVGKGTVFTEQELDEYWYKRTRPIIFKFLYNFPFAHRVILKEIREILQVDFSNQPYWGFFPYTDEQFEEILIRGKVDEGLIID